MHVSEPDAPIDLAEAAVGQPLNPEYLHLFQTGTFTVQRRRDWRTLYGGPPTWTFCTADQIHICTIGEYAKAGYPNRCGQCGRTRYPGDPQ